jgi:hypothetical protein
MSQMEKILSKKHNFLSIVALLAIAGSLYFAVINPDRFGFYHDDGIYLVTAKALATGHGYKILSLPDELWQTKYPPVFPLALSVIWRANPDFPADLLLFSEFTALCTLIFLALTAIYLVRRSYASPIQILLVLLFASLNWRTIILATSILSEPLYAALAVGVLWFTSSMGEKRVSAKGLGLGILLALAALTRLAGISLLAAILLYGLTRRQIRRFLLPIILSFSMIVGWFWWCYLHQSSSIGPHAVYYTNYFQNWLSLIHSDELGIKHSLLGLISLMVGRNLVTMLSTIPVVCFGVQINRLQSIVGAWQFVAILIGLVTIILLVIGFVKTHAVGNGLLHYYIVVYLALHLLWPYTIYDRILIPILPFLLFFIVSGGTHLLRHCFEDCGIHERPAKVTSLIFLCILLASLFTTACFGLAFGFLEQFKDSKMAYGADAQEKRELTAWLKANSRKSDILLCYQDPVYFLYAGRKAIRLPPPNQNEPFVSYADRLQNFVEENRVTLLLRTENDFSLESYPTHKRTILKDTLDYRSSYFAPIYSTSNQEGRVYGINPGEAFNAK